MVLLTECGTNIDQISVLFDGYSFQSTNGPEQFLHSLKASENDVFRGHRKREEKFCIGWNESWLESSYSIEFEKRLGQQQQQAAIDSFVYSEALHWQKTCHKIYRWCRHVNNGK